MKNVSVIGSGFSGLAAACFLAKNNFDVQVFEKNASPGGRARKFESDGFVFDMGPSWYWMPDVFENFFNAFGKTTGDYYQLKRLDPSYRVYFGKKDYIDIPAGSENVAQLFEELEPGSGQKLKRFLREGHFKYELGVKKLVYKPGLSLREFVDPQIFQGLFKLHVFQSISTYIRKFFKDPRIIKILEFPVLFLGATPEKTPALYSLMNYADIQLGTWYPEGGMFKVVHAMVTLAKELGVKFKFDSAVDSFEMNSTKAKGVWSNATFHPSNYIVAAADYQHVDQQLLPKNLRNYSATYWDKRVMAPGSLLFYLGLNKKLKNLQHHTLFFDEDFRKHASEIYDTPQWPTAPQFYISCPSKSDSSVAPGGCENLLILMPVAPGLEDRNDIREKYFKLIIDRLESLIGETVRDHIIFKRSYAHNDFVSDYNAFKGNAYGLANTLFQTANFKPTIINKKVSNLFYTGQLTVPGPGVPPAIISGEVVARTLMKQQSVKASYETDF
jgi:phytoene desaturase